MTLDRTEKPTPLFDNPADWSSPQPAGPPDSQKVARAIEAAFRESGQALLHTVGESMLPLIPPGSRVLIRPVASDRLRVGDIVAALCPGPMGGLRLHHVVDIEPPRSKIYTIGDNGLIDDPPVPMGQVIARAERLVRPDGKRVNLQSPAIRLYSFGIITGYRLRRFLVRHHIRLGRGSRRIAGRLLFRLIDRGLKWPVSR